MGALGDLSKTLSTSANQIRIMKEQSQELAMWAGQMINMWLQNEGILVKVNAFANYSQVHIEIISIRIRL